MSFRLARCSSTHIDGRRCCRPGHSDGTRHLLARDPANPSRETLVKVAEAWGYPTKMAKRAVDGAMDGSRESGQRLSIDRFLSMIETFANALLEADEEKRNRERPAGDA